MERSNCFRESSVIEAAVWSINSEQLAAGRCISNVKLDQRDIFLLRWAHLLSRRTKAHGGYFAPFRGFMRCSSSFFLASMGACFHTGASSSSSLSASQSSLNVFTSKPSNLDNTTMTGAERGYNFFDSQVTGELTLSDASLDLVEENGVRSQEWSIAVRGHAIPCSQN